MEKRRGQVRAALEEFRPDLVHVASSGPTRAGRTVALDGRRLTTDPREELPTLG